MAKIHTEYHHVACNSCAGAHIENRGSKPEHWADLPASEAIGESCDNCGTRFESDNQSDNDAAARAVSNTIQAPGNRASDSNRRPQLDHSYEDRQEMERENVHEIMGGMDYGD
jgi:hypothetical protein